MTANVVMSFDESLLVFDQKEWESGFGDANVIANVGKPLLMGYQNPLFGEDRSSLKLEHGWGSVPGSWECLDGGVILLGFCLFGGHFAQRLEPAAHDELSIRQDVGLMRCQFGWMRAEVSQQYRC